LDGTSFLVDSLSDVIANDGVVTLREAIEAANTNAKGGGVWIGNGVVTIVQGTITNNLGSRPAGCDARAVDRQRRPHAHPHALKWKSLDRCGQQQFRAGYERGAVGLRSTRRPLRPDARRHGRRGRRRGVPRARVLAQRSGRGPGRRRNGRRGLGPRRRAGQLPDHRRARPRSAWHQRRRQEPELFHLRSDAQRRRRTPRGHLRADLLDEHGLRPGRRALRHRRIAGAQRRGDRRQQRRLRKRRRAAKRFRRHRRTGPLHHLEQLGQLRWSDLRQW